MFTAVLKHDVSNIEGGVDNCKRRFPDVFTERSSRTRIGKYGWACHDDIILNLEIYVRIRTVGLGVCHAVGEYAGEARAIRVIIGELNFILQVTDCVASLRHSVEGNCMNSQDIFVSLIVRATIDGDCISS